MLKRLGVGARTALAAACALLPAAAAASGGSSLDMKFEYFRDANKVWNATPCLLLKKALDRKWTFGWEQEFDVVTGASRRLGADKIGPFAGNEVDAISSASKVENRHSEAPSLTYSHRGVTASGSLYTSHEPDYVSWSPAGSFSMDFFDRNLTLREVRQAFYKNPDFPLVPSLDDIRHAEFQLLSLGWEIVDASGEPVTITEPGQIAVSSVNLLLRRRPVEPDEPPQDSGVEDAADGESGQEDQPPPSGTGEGQPPGSGQPDGDAPSAVSYKRYRIRIPSLSVTSPQARNNTWKLFSELRKLLDPANEDLDHQLIQLDLTLTTADGQQGELEQRARDIGARWDVEDDEF